MKAVTFPIYLFLSLCFATGRDSFPEIYKDPKDSVSCSFGGTICGPGCCDSLLGWHCCCVVTDTDIEWLCAARKVECPSAEGRLF